MTLCPKHETGGGPCYCPPAYVFLDTDQYVVGFLKPAILPKSKSIPNVSLYVEVSNQVNPQPTAVSDEDIPF